MAPKKEKDKQRKTIVTPTPTIRDPSLPASIPTNPRSPPLPLIDVAEEPWRRKFCKYIYNKNDKTICERSCKSWCIITGYAIIYMIFLCTYMLIILFVSLVAMKYFRDFKNNDNLAYLTYSDNGIGLSVTPTSESSYPLIWYKKNDESEFGKYVNTIDKLMLKKRKKRQTNNTDLGPCGIRPYGYGDKPCILIRINKQRMWKGIPLQRNSSKAREAPEEVQNWLNADQKLWLTCSGYHSYDKEHIGNIKYFPDPPRFDPNMFPLDMQSSSPIVAVQITDFTLGLSLAIQCKLWYENGPSTIEFMLYVEPGGNGSNDTSISG